MNGLGKYDLSQSYQWNYDHCPEPVAIKVPELTGRWNFGGLKLDSPIGIPAGPLLNGQWCMYYASLGFDFLTYKTVRSVERACYPLPNLQPVVCGQLQGSEDCVTACDDLQSSWAASFGMPSQPPKVWRQDVEATRNKLPKQKLLCVSVVGTIQDGWSMDQLAEDYAQCAKWAIESGADCIEANFSCPNVSTCDGQLFQNPTQSANVAARIREAVGRTPFLVKIGQVNSPESAIGLVDTLAPFIDGFAMTNSLALTVRDRNNQLMFGGQRRGICGSATFEASLRQTRLFSDHIRDSKFELDLIGVGGISTSSHVRKYLDAGASLVHLATSAMINPRVGIEIKRQLQDSFTASPNPPTQT